MRELRGFKRKGNLLPNDGAASLETGVFGQTSGSALRLAEDILIHQPSSIQRSHSCQAASSHARQKIPSFFMKHYDALPLSKHPSTD